MAVLTRDPAAYRRKKAEQARSEFAAQRAAAIEAQQARRDEFARQRAEAIEAEKDKRKSAMDKAKAGDPESPMWAQVRQCYVEHRPSQVANERRMQRCSGGPVLPIFPGRKVCLASDAVEKLSEVA